jgi:hypothetical protein
MILNFLIPSLLLLLFANLLAQSRVGVGGVLGLCGLGFVLGFFCLHPTLMLHALLLVVAGVVCLCLGGGARRFLRCSLAATVTTYLVISYFVLLSLQDNADWRRLYPFKSLTGRLAYETRAKTGGAGSVQKGRSDEREVAAGESSPEAAARWAEVERKVEGTDDWLRAISLKHVHQSFVMQFINSPGFGFDRHLNTPRNSYITLPPSELIPLSSLDGASGDQSESRPGPQPTSQADELRLAASVSSDQPLWRMHQDGLINFVNALGFGYVRDRDHVAGFQPHGFGHPGRFRDTGLPPRPPERWRLRRIELVSLLKYDRPAVYLSDNLPRMEDLSDARPRPLDAFETSALPALQGGEDLMATTTGSTMRVLGALRAMRQCVSCHNAERGDLLGAFSYELRRAPAVH